jgi:hypothetical protein
MVNAGGLGVQSVRGRVLLPYFQIGAMMKTKLLAAIFSLMLALVFSSGCSEDPYQKAFDAYRAAQEAHPNDNDFAHSDFDNVIQLLDAVPESKGEKYNSAQDLKKKIEIVRQEAKNAVEAKAREAEREKAEAADKAAREKEEQDRKAKELKALEKASRDKLNVHGEIDQDSAECMNKCIEVEKTCKDGCEGKKSCETRCTKAQAKCMAACG